MSNRSLLMIALAVVIALVALDSFVIVKETEKAVSSSSVPSCAPISSRACTSRRRLSRT